MRTHDHECTAQVALRISRDAISTGSVALTDLVLGDGDTGEGCFRNMVFALGCDRAFVIARL